MVKEPINNPNEEEDEDLVTLLDDDGNEVDFYHAATVDYKGEWYIFLQPAEEMEDVEEDELLIFKLEQDENGDDLFTPIEDEALLDAVYHEYEKLVEETDAEECGCGCEHEEHEHKHEQGCCTAETERGHEHKHEGGCGAAPEAKTEKPESEPKKQTGCGCKTKK